MRGRWSAMCGCRQRLQPQFTVKNPSLHSGFSFFLLCAACSLRADLQLSQERKQDGGEAGETVLASAGSNIYA